MKRGKWVSLEEHRRLAKHLKAARYHLGEMHSICSDKYLLSDPIIKGLERMLLQGGELHKLYIRLGDSFYRLAERENLDVEFFYNE